MNTNIQLGIDQAIEALYKFSGQSDKMIKYNEDGRECESCIGYVSCLTWMQDGLKAKRPSCNGWYYANTEQVEGLLTDWYYRRGKIKPKKEYDMSEQQTKYDPKSTHYNSGGIETLDYIKAKLTPDQFQGFCMGNVLKYTSRANTKGNFKRDMEKAAYYSKWATQEDGK